MQSLASYWASCIQMHFLSFCGVALSSCIMYYVCEEVVAVLLLEVVTKMSFVGLFQSNVDRGFLAHLGSQTVLEKVQY